MRRQFGFGNPRHVLSEVSLCIFDCVSFFEMGKHCEKVIRPDPLPWPEDALIKLSPTLHAERIEGSVIGSKQDIHDIVS